jgi:histone-lysine N-methyltransferase SETD3
MCHAQAITQPGSRLIELPRSCQLTYDESSDARVLSLIQQVPEELWGAKLALQVRRQPCIVWIWCGYEWVHLPPGMSGVPTKEPAFLLLCNPCEECAACDECHNP